MRRPLVLAAHGTDDPQGRAVIEQVALAAGHQLGVEAWVGYVDVCEPTLVSVLTQVSAATAPVVVPFFLATGYHVKYDVPGAAEAVTGAVVSRALGVEPEVLGALADRVDESRAGSGASPADDAAGGRDPDALVLVAAGSSHDDARAEVAQVAQRLGEEFGVPAVAAFLSGPGLRPDAAVGELRHTGHEAITLVVHLLAPGYFADRARRYAADLGVGVTGAPLGTHPLLTDLVVRRYREADGATG